MRITRYSAAYRSAPAFAMKYWSEVSADSKYSTGYGVTHCHGCANLIPMYDGSPELEIVGGEDRMKRRHIPSVQLDVRFVCTDRLGQAIKRSVIDCRREKFRFCKLILKAALHVQ